MAKARVSASLNNTDAVGVSCVVMHLLSVSSFHPKCILSNIVVSQSLYNVVG